MHPVERRQTPRFQSTAFTTALHTVVCIRRFQRVIRRVGKTNKISVSSWGAVWVAAALVGVVGARWAAVRCQPATATEQMATQPFVSNF